MKAEAFAIEKNRIDIFLVLVVIEGKKGGKGEKSELLRGFCLWIKMWKKRGVFHREYGLKVINILSLHLWKTLWKMFINKNFDRKRV